MCIRDRFSSSSAPATPAMPIGPVMNTSSERLKLCSCSISSVNTMNSMIGVSLFLLAFDAAFGFVSLLGVIALAGMIMRNSVILVDQIDQDIAAGHSAWDAVIDATVRRARPILLTAGTAIFAMVPLSRSVFFGPMAVALMGGLLVATALTLLFLPALYAAWFRVKRPAAKPASVDTGTPHGTRPPLAIAAE